MKLPNTERGFPAGEPNESWTKQQFLDLLRYQLKNLLADDGKIRKAVEATDADIQEIKADIAKLERQIFLEKVKLN